MLKNYRDMKAQQKSSSHCLELYITTKNFKKEKRYALTSQIRMAAVNKGKLKSLKDDTKEVKRMLSAGKIVGKQTLEPLTT